MTLPQGIHQRGNSYVVDVTVKGIRRTATTPLDLDKALSVQADLRADFSGRALRNHRRSLAFILFLCSASKEGNLTAPPACF